MATYTIEYTTTAAKALAKLERSARDRIAEAIGNLADDPRPHGAIKLTGREGMRIRVGNYRVMYVIDDAIVTITVVKIGHRGNVYER